MGKQEVRKMSKKKTEQLRNEEIDDTMLQRDNDVTFVCPVCGKLLHKNNLVDAKSIVEDNLYYVGGILIVSDVWLHCDFEHRYDEDGMTLDEPHNLVAVVKAAFDKKGDCIHFDIMDIRPREKA
ncbi:MAG: hypothetical protein AYK19_15305 [Theionarchaea archaeon DG-70-1]|nr:MAG: hypothetical protein AYK19_15305 [Theionarchaea archaeon DG-70-1]